jgi:hypothetical protein
MDSGQGAEMDYGIRLLTADQREPKLPVWAQDTINDLRREYARERERAQAARLATDPDKSTTVIEAYSDRGPIGLGNAVVRFKLGDLASHSGPTDGPYVECHVHDDGSLYVRGSAQIVLAPDVSNVVRIRVAGR